MLSHCDTCTTPYPADMPVCPNCGAVARHTNDTPLVGCPHCEEALMAKTTVATGPSNAQVEPDPKRTEVAVPAAALESTPTPEPESVPPTAASPADEVPPAPPATAKAAKK